MNNPEQNAERLAEAEKATPKARARFDAATAALELAEKRAAATLAERDRLADEAAAKRAERREKRAELSAEQLAALDAVAASLAMDAEDAAEARREALVELEAARAEEGQARRAYFAAAEDEEAARALVLRDRMAGPLAELEKIGAEIGEAYRRGGEARSARGGAGGASGVVRLDGPPLIARAVRNFREGMASGLW